MVNTTTSYKSIKSLCIYSQNVGRKWSWVVNLLESRKLEFDIIFLHEPLWSTVRYSASLTEKTGDPVRGPPVHPDWWVIYPKELIWKRIDHVCLLMFTRGLPPVNLSLELMLSNTVSSCF